GRRGGRRPADKGDGAGPGRVTISRAAGASPLVAGARGGTSGCRGSLSLGVFKRLLRRKPLGLRPSNRPQQFGAALQRFDCSRGGALQPLGLGKPAVQSIAFVDQPRDRLLGLACALPKWIEPTAFGGGVASLLAAG